MFKRKAWFTGITAVFILTLTGFNTVSADVPSWFWGALFNWADGVTAEVDAVEAVVTTQQVQIDALETGMGGVEFFDSSANITVTTTPSTVMSVAVTSPSTGFIIVSFSSAARIAHGVGTRNTIRLWISTNPASQNTFDETWRFVDIQSVQPTGTYWDTIHSQAVFPVTAGTTTYYARADSSGADGLFFRNTSMNAIFVPNRY